MNDFWKGAIVALLILAYVVFPFDALPGPVDDGILIILGIISAYKKYCR